MEENKESERNKSIKQKSLGQETNISIAPTAIKPQNYDIFVQEGKWSYCLLQNPSYTRSEYTDGAKLEEAEELYETLQKPEDIYFVRGELPPEDFYKGERLYNAGDQEGLNKLEEQVMDKISQFREIGSKFFYKFDDLE